MRYTLLEMTQRILEALESDEVDSISDTEESYTVANIIKECYYEIIGRQNLPEHDDIFQLTASGDSAKPTVMTVPDEVLDVQKVMYNTGTTADPYWTDLTFVPLRDFISIVNAYDTDNTTVGTMVLTNRLSQNFTFKYRNDIDPTYYTTFDDDTILFDAYNSDNGSTLVSARTLCYGALEPDFTMSDNYIPDVDPRQMQLLLQSAKAQAFYEIKQIENPKAERKERRNEILAQRSKNTVDRRGGSKTYRRYGRK